MSTDVNRVGLRLYVFPRPLNPGRDRVNGVSLRKEARNNETVAHATTPIPAQTSS